MEEGFAKLIKILDKKETTSFSFKEYITLLLGFSSIKINNWEDNLPLSNYYSGSNMDFLDAVKFWITAISENKMLNHHLFALLRI